MMKLIGGSGLNLALNLQICDRCNTAAIFWT